MEQKIRKSIAASEELVDLFLEDIHTLSSVLEGELFDAYKEDLDSRIEDCNIIIQKLKNIISLTNN